MEYEPLTAKQKFMMATKDTFDPPILLISGGLPESARPRDKILPTGRGRAAT
jgi:hypothetical protein